MFLKIVLWGIGLYFLYKFIYGFVLPVYRTTRTVRRQFRDVQSKMNEQFRAQQQQQEQSRQQQEQASRSKQVVGDYIEFEEVKK
jgi:hypothetical protein